MRADDISSAARGAYACGRGGRLALATLVVVAWTSLPLLLFALVAATDPPLTPPVVLRLFLLGAALPALAARGLRTFFGARIALADGRLVVARRDRRLEVPPDAVADVVPWAIPLPGPGLAVRLRSGRLLRWRIGVDDPSALRRALAAAGIVAAAGADRRPAAAWAEARAAVLARRRWWRPLAKFVGFALAPALVLFNAFEHIAYGAFFGEWYLYGPAAWLGTLLEHWVTVAIYLVLWAGTWRGVAEAVCLGGAVVAPARAAQVRRAAEIGCGLVYWLGVPVLLGLRFLD